jgi:glutathione synthase/RimK-type ligase-like ATP-grasp enzyme
MKPCIENKFPIAYPDVYIDESWSGLHAILFTFIGARWFGHPHLDKINSSKLAQKIIADRLKQNIKQVLTPDTILANHSSELISFCEKYPYLIIKPIDSRGVVNEEEWIPFFSERISSSDLKAVIREQKYPNLNYCLLQEYIEKKHEWRITVVDQNVFGCLILSQDNENSKTDWRRIGYEEISHMAAEPPKYISDFCKQFLNSLQIHFGAFDFIETPEGKFYFLECNVNGQWLWIEESTGQKISKSIAEALRHTIS